MRRRRALVDFDGTIAEYHGFRGPGRYGSPLPGARAGLEALVAAGYDVVVHTSRAALEREAIAAYMLEHGLPCGEVICDKPMAHLYIDDRALQGGDWAAVIAEVERREKADEAARRGD